MKISGYLMKRKNPPLRKLSRFIFLFLVSSIPAATDSTFTFGKANLHCGISLPQIKQDSTAGLIVWFHGGMRTRDTKKGILAYKAIHPFIDPDKYYVISPAAHREADWLNFKVISDVNALITSLVNKFPIDSTNINLVGVSDGSIAVIKISLHTHYPIRKRILFSSAPNLIIRENELKRQAMHIKGGWHFFQGVKDRLFAADKVIPFLYYWKKTVPGTVLHIYQEGEHDFGWYVKNAKSEIKELFP